MTPKTVCCTAALAFALLYLHGQPSQAADSDKLKLIQTIPLDGDAGRLDHMALDAKGERLFVANLSNNSLDVVDLKTGRLVKQIPDQKKIQGIVYVPGLDRIFVGNGVSETCNAFDGKTYKLLHSLKMPEADNVRFDPSSGLVYVGHAEHALTAFDAKNYEIKATVKLPGPPEAFQLDVQRKRLYLNIVQPSLVAVVDLAKHELVAKYELKLAERNYPMALDPDQQHIYVGCRKPPMVVALDAKNGKELWGVAIPGDIDDLFFDAKRKRLYASCGEGFLAILEEKDGRFALVEKLPTAKLARTCFFDPEAGRLYLGVPRDDVHPKPEIRVYQARP